jgi:hypothetical protein
MKCVNCPCDYDDIYLCCPQCGYPAQDLPIFEAEPDYDDMLMDCENGDHNWELTTQEENTYDSCVCLYCGMVRNRDLVNMTSQFLEPHFGHPPNGLQPLRFTPAYDECTPEEIKRWETDLANNTPCQSDTGWIKRGDITIHVLASSWGIGTYYLEVENPQRGVNHE